MREIYLKTLGSAVESFYNQIKVNNLFKIEDIKHLISFVGLSKIREYENSNIENSCSLFPRLERLTIFCTKESFDNTKNLKIYAVNKNIKINIINIEANISYKELYLILLRIIGSDDFQSIFFDTTQGMKAISINFYKLGIELGIKSLNWVTTQTIKENYNLFRSVDSLRIDFLDNPKRDNYNFFKIINDSIEKYDLDTVSKLYKSINDNDKSNFFNLLCYIFDDSSIEYSLFEESVNKFISQFPNFSLSCKKRFSNVFNILSFFSNKIDSDVSIVNFDSLVNNTFKDIISEDEAEYLYNYLLIPFIIKKFKNSEIRSLIFSKKLSLAFKKDKIDYNSNDINYYKRILNNFFKIRGVEIFKNHFNFIDFLKENLFSDIDLSVEKIQVEGCNISLKDNKIIKRFFSKDLKSLVLKELITNGNKEIFIGDIIRIIEELGIINISKAFSDLEKNFSQLNSELNVIFSKENLEYRDIIKYIPNKKTRLIKYMDTVECSYNYPKIYICLK